jgi:hypothetical protein
VTSARIAVIQLVIVAMTSPFGPPAAPVIPGLSKLAEAPTVGCEKVTRVGCGPGVLWDCVGARVGLEVRVTAGVAVAVSVGVGDANGDPDGVGVAFGRVSDRWL